jgi:membrane protein
MNRVPEKLQSVYSRLNRLSGGLLDILMRAFGRFGQNRGAEAAASISYYTIFSIFPLLIFTVTAISYFIEPAQAFQFLANLSNRLPISLETVAQQAEKLNQSRGLFSLIGLIGFLWAASGVFDTLTKNLDRAWGRSEPRPFVTRRLVAIGMVVGLAGAVLVAVIFTALFDFSLIGSLLSPINSPELRGIILGLERFIPPLLIRLCVIWLIYRLVPAAHVRGWPAFWGALLVSLAWGIVTAGFSWYLKSGFSTYDVIYGSLGAAIAFLTWIYICTVILLIGAYLTEAIQNREPVFEPS